MNFSKNDNLLVNWKSLKKKEKIKLFSFTMFAVLAGIVILYLGLAWKFVSAMTHPVCQDAQHFLELATPMEHWLTTEDGHEIRTWYYPSTNGAAILSLGGLSGSLGVQLPPVERFVEEGFGVLQIDSRACAIPSAPVTLGAKELFDAAAGLNFLLTRQEVDPKKIGVIGFSMGGATAIRIAARHSEIQAVIRDGGYSNLGRLLNGTEQNSSAAVSLFGKTTLLIYKLQTGIDPWSVNTLADLPKISPRPVLLIFGEYEADPGAEQFSAAGEGKTLWIVPGGRHGQNHQLDPDKYEERIIDFFNHAFEQ